MNSAVVYEFEQRSGEKRLGFSQRRWRRGDTDEGFESEAKLSWGEVLWEDLRR